MIACRGAGEPEFPRDLGVISSLADECQNLPFTPREASLARLDETPLGAAPVNESSVAFTAGPHAVVTLLVR